MRRTPTTTRRFALAVLAATAVAVAFRRPACGAPAFAGAPLPTRWPGRAGGGTTGSVSQRRAKDEKTDDERLEFMDSPLGQVIGFLAKGLSSGPLNEGKIWFAKMQAGEYDEAAVSAKLQSYISNNPVVMFSFSK